MAAIHEYWPIRSTQAMSAGYSITRKLQFCWEKVKKTWLHITVQIGPLLPWLTDTLKRSCVSSITWEHDGINSLPALSWSRILLTPLSLTSVSSPSLLALTCFSSSCLRICLRWVSISTPCALNLSMSSLIPWICSYKTNEQYEITTW